MVKEYYNIFSCPDDQSELEYHESYLECTKCHRKFEVLADNFVSLLPNSPLEYKGKDRKLRKHLAQFYKNSFYEEFEWNKNAMPWRLPTHPKEKLYRSKKIRRASEILGPKLGRFCDVPGGDGTYSLEYASKAKLVIYCDILVDNLNFVFFEAQKRKLKNVLFCRCDYFSLPFKEGTFDTVICMDTLLVGIFNELILLRNIHYLLNATGKALIDFQNSLYNPLRRIKYRFTGLCRSYTKHQAEKLLKKAGINRYKFYPYYFQEAEPGVMNKLSGIIKALIPLPNLLMFVFGK